MVAQPRDKFIFPSCSKKSRNDRYGLVIAVTLPGTETFFSPCYTIFSLWLSSPAYKMAAGTPATITTFQIEYGGKGRANAAYQMSQLPLKSFPRGPHPMTSKYTSLDSSMSYNYFYLHGRLGNRAFKLRPFQN